MNLETLVLPLEIASNAFNTGIKAATAGVAALVGAMGVAVKATFDWAQELDSIQDIIGGTNAESAALNFTLRKSGVDTAKFTSGVTIMSKGLVKADGTLDTVGRDLKDFGINVLDANGAVKEQNKLIAEISNKYNSFSTQQERVNFLTKTFGRSGAELLDFFDTLAADGGIDAVTSKVERLGLVIDPGRYEQFTRSLEELKLVGLGLAVGFTEKVMPAFERFLEIITGEGTLGQKIGTLAANADAYIGNFIGNVGDSVNAWVDGGGPQELSSKLISWIENIGTGENQSRIVTAAQYLVTAIGNALSSVDWAGVGLAIDTKITETINGIDWTGAGDTFGGWIDTFLTTGWDMGIADAGMNMPTSISALLDGIDNFFQSAVGADKFGGWDAYFQAWWDDIAGWFDKIESFMRDRLGALQGLSISKNENWINDMKNGAANSNFTSITVEKNPNWFNELFGNSSNRASGGPVIAGQSYNVAEFFQPERFTPSTNGRIDPIGTGGDMLTTLTLMLQQFADEIARSNRVAFEKVGRR